jgi:predicted nucleic acid-binding protein
MNGVLIDTSVWIEYFRGNRNYIDPGLELIELGMAYSLEVVFAELAQGAKGKREMEVILTFFSNMKLLDSPGLIFKAGVYSKQNRLIEKGIGLIDAILIVCTIENDLKLWTLDKKILSFLESERVFHPKTSD